MSAINDRFTKAAMNQEFVKNLAEDGAICNYAKREYDEQKTFDGGEGPRSIFQTINKKVQTYHTFLKCLLGEDRQNIDEAIPVIDYFKPDNSSFLTTYAVHNDIVDSTQFCPVPDSAVINHALVGDPEAEYFYNTRSSVSSQHNIQAGIVDSNGWIYRGVKTGVTIINGSVDYNLKNMTLEFYCCDSANGTTLSLSYLQSGSGDFGNLPESRMLTSYNSSNPNSFKVLPALTKYSNSSSVIVVHDAASNYKLPAWMPGDTVLGNTGTGTLTAENRTWYTINLAEGDIVIALPGDVSQLAVKNRIILLKKIPLAGHEETETVFTYTVNGSSQKITLADGLLLNDYLVFFFYSLDIRKDFEFEPIEASSPVPGQLEELLDQNPYLFTDLLQFERVFFGSASGLMNGLYSTPYKYDQSFSEARQNSAAGTDELQYPRVLTWRFDNHVDIAALRGMTIPPGAHYFPGHLLNRGTIISAPLKRSGYDPIAKYVNQTTRQIVKFEYLKNGQRYYGNPVNGYEGANETTAPANADRIEYFGKAEIYYDVLNGIDISDSLFTQFSANMTTSEPGIYRGLTSPELITLNDFPISISDKGSRLRYPLKLFTRTPAVSTANEARLRQYGFNTSSFGSTGSPYTADDIYSYIDSFFDCFDNPKNPTRLYLDYRDSNDLALYRSSEEYSSYRRLAGVTVTYWKGDKQVSAGTKNATTKTENAYDTVAATTNTLLADTLENLESTPNVSFFFEYMHQYHSINDNPPFRPAATVLNSNGTKSPTDAVTGKNPAFGLNCKLQVLTPMDTFMPKTGTFDRLLVYPAYTSKFPKYLFLFSKTNLEEELGTKVNGKYPLLDNGNSIPLSFYDSNSRDFVIFEASRAWHYNFANLTKVTFYTPETDDWPLNRDLQYPIWKNELSTKQASLNSLRTTLASYPDYSRMDVSSHKEKVTEEYEVRGRVRTRSTTQTTYKITYPKGPTDSTSVGYAFVKASIEAQALEKLAQLKGVSIDSLERYLANIDKISEVDESTITNAIQGCSQAFKDLLLNIWNWAKLSKQVSELEGEIAKLQQNINSVTYRNYTQEFYCYLLQPVSLTMDWANAFHLYQQELSGVDSETANTRINFPDNGDKFDIGLVTSSAEYFKLGPRNDNTGEYDRTSLTQAEIAADLKKLASSRIYCTLPKFDGSKTAGWYASHSSNFFQAYGKYIYSLTMDPDSAIRKLTARITQNLLEQFQLSVVSTASYQAPILLTDLPAVLDGLFILRSPLTTLALSHVSIPISSHASGDYAIDSQENLGDLSQLLIRYEDDLYYFPTDLFSQFPVTYGSPDWTAISFSVNGNFVTYTYSGITAQTQLFDQSGTAYSETTIRDYLLQNFGAIQSGDTYQISLTDNLAKLKTSVQQFFIDNFNRLVRCVLKAWMKKELSLSLAEIQQRAEKVQHSFKYLQDNFSDALTQATVQGFSSELCRRLDQQFGDGSRPFLNMEMQSCSFAVDQTVESLKQIYIKRLANASMVLLQGLQANLVLDSVKQVWNQYFGDPAGTSFDNGASVRNASFLIPASRLLLDIKVRFDRNSSEPDTSPYNPQILDLINQLVNQGYGDANLASFVFKPLTALKSYVTQLPGWLKQYQQMNGSEVPQEAIDTVVGKKRDKGGFLSVLYNIKWAIRVMAFEQNFINLYTALRKVVIHEYNRKVNAQVASQSGLTEADLETYLGHEDLGVPGVFEFYEPVTGEPEEGEDRYIYQNNRYVLVTPSSPAPAGATQYALKWGFKPSDTGNHAPNNYYYIPEYCTQPTESEGSEESSSVQVLSPAVTDKFYAVKNGYYLVNLNMHLPNIIYNATEDKFKLQAPEVNVGTLNQPGEGETLGTFANPVDESQVFQVKLPVPNASNNDVNEALLKAIADMSRQALFGQNSSPSSGSTLVTLTGDDTEPTGDPSSLYFKRFQALNARMNRISGSLYSAARTLKNRALLQSYSQSLINTVSVYENLMKVVPVAKFDEVTYLPTQAATASTIPLEGRFYYNAEMTELRAQISDKCVLTCTSCSVKDNCPFYNEDEILKLYCTPASYLNLYFKDNQLDLLYYDDEPGKRSPDIYEYEDALVNGVLVKKQIGDSIPSEEFKALHKPYSEVLQGASTDRQDVDWIAPARPIKTAYRNPDSETRVYSMPSLEEEFRQSKKLAWDETLDGDLGWLTNARYGTIEANSMANLFNRQYQALNVRPYKYLHNALFVFDEESEFEYQPSPDFYDIKNIYIPDPEGQEHRFGGQTRILLPTTLRALAEANPEDDVYLVSDDTQDETGAEISPVIYLDTVANLRKPGRTAFNLDTISSVGAESSTDTRQYACDIAEWSVRLCKNHNANWPASGDMPTTGQTHHSLAENRDQYWMENVVKRIEKTDQDGKQNISFITLPGRPRVSSGYQEPLIDPDNPDESSVISGKPVVADYINFIRQFSIRLCDIDPEDKSKIIWYIKWIKDLDGSDTVENRRRLEEKRRTLALMKTNLRLVIIKN